MTKTTMTRPTITRRLAGAGGAANYGQDRDGCWYVLGFNGWTLTSQAHRATRFYRQMALRARFDAKRRAAIAAKIRAASGY